MPNHCTMIGLCAQSSDDQIPDSCSVSVTNSNDVAALNGADLCELAFPMPKELIGIVASAKPARYRNRTTGEFSDDCNGIFGDDWERIDLTSDEIVDLQEKFGAATWYDWCCLHWGTKWGTYDLTARVLPGDGSPVLIECQTAWGPPNPKTMSRINKYLQDNYGLYAIKWIGFDPATNNTREIAVDL